MNANLGTVIDPIAFAADILEGATVQDAIAKNPGGTYTREGKGKKCLYLRVDSGVLQPRTDSGQQNIQRLIKSGAAKPYDLEQQDQAVAAAATQAAEDTASKVRQERRAAPKVEGNAWADEPEEKPEPEPEEKPQGWTLPDGNDDD